MKEIIIIIIILIIILGCAIYTQNFLNKTADLLVSKLEELKSEIQKNSIGIEEMVNKADNIYNEWGNINEKWSVIVLHDEIDLIETSLIRMKSKIKMNRTEESMEDLDTSIFLVNHIKEKEKINLKNIF